MADTTITKRVGSEPLETTAKRVPSGLTEVTTKRIAADATADNTKRVITSGAVVTYGNDTWGRTWGGTDLAHAEPDPGHTWGLTWHYGTLASADTPESPSQNNTVRIAAATDTITENTTKRIPAGATL